MTGEEAQTGQDLRELYRELILDHARNPRPFGRLATSTHSAEGINPLCGDKLRIYLRIDGGEHIDEVSFEGSGCAISMASASLLTETVSGRGVDEALGVSATIVNRLTGTASEPGSDLGKLVALEGVRDYPSRVKCATLAWHALRSAIERSPDPATTE